MAYAAAVSLMEFLKQQLHSDEISVSFPKSEIVSIYIKLCSLKCFLEKDFLVHDLEIQIKDAICSAEDIIRSGGSEYASSGGAVFSELDSIAVTVAKIVDDNPDRDREDGQGRCSTRAVLSRFLQGNKKLVGIDDGLMRLRNQLDIGKSSKLKVVAVVGMIGIGKTTVVNEVYDDPSVNGHVFSYKAWVKLGPTCTFREIMLGLLQSMDLDVFQERSTKQLSDCLCEVLKGGRYLVVLDDICDIKMWDDLKDFLPDENNGSRIILTTRLRKVARYAAGGASENVHEVRFLDKEDESWELLRYAAIGGDSCTSELMNIGKVIARNCQGLPLSIIVMGSLLSNLWPAPEIWDIVANNRGIHNHGMLMVTQSIDRDQPLPFEMKVCFLYMAAFPLYHEISASKLHQLWVAEGFLHKIDYRSYESTVEAFLKEFFDRSLLLVHRWRSASGIKTCSIHSAIWPFFARTAADGDFFQAFESFKDKVHPGRRRFSIHKNILFAIKDVHKSMAAASATRSLICTGPYHPYPLRVSFGFRLLKVLDALSIRFYKFPYEILKLHNLKFLALTLNRVEIPPSVSKLRNIQFLIVRQHLSIKSCGTPSFLPMEIWNMKELRHLQVMGSDLPAPFHVNAFLPNLLTLSDVSALSCKREILERTPNLKKLGVRIVLSRNAAITATSLNLFDQLGYLDQLESFKCIVINPFLETRVTILPDLVFPSSLKKVTLSGCGFSWKSMKEIARLCNLEVLKLRCHALRGPEWEVNEDEFCSLKFLLLEDLDIEQWKANYSSCFPVLKRLAIHHCYKLREIPPILGEITTLESIELVDCIPSVVVSAMRIKGEQLSIGNELLQVRNHSSWTDGKLKL